MKTFSCLYRSYATDICILFFFIHRDTSQCILTFLNEWMLDYFGEGNGTPLQYSCLKNPMGGGAWKAAVNGVAEGRTWLSNFTFTFHFHALEKETATCSSVLAWRIPGTGEPGGLLSMELHRVRHNWSDLAAAAAAPCLWISLRKHLAMVIHLWGIVQPWRTPKRG